MSEQKKWETKPNTGSAFVNKRKQKDTHPDYTGEVLVLEPGLYWFSMWEKKRGNGEPWFSIGLNPKEPLPRQEQRTGATGVPLTKSEVLDDETPF